MTRNTILRPDEIQRLHNELLRINAIFSEMTHNVLSRALPKKLILDNGEIETIYDDSTQKALDFIEKSRLDHIKSDLTLSEYLKESGIDL